MNTESGDPVEDPGTKLGSVPPEALDRVFETFPEAEKVVSHTSLTRVLSHEREGISRQI